jgi:hypothetical protein
MFLQLMADRKQREQVKDWGPGITFKGLNPVTHFLQLGPTSHSAHHLPE